MEKIVQPVDKLVARGRYFLISRLLYNPVILAASVLIVKKVQPDISVMRVIVLGGISYATTFLWLLGFRFKKILPYVGFPIGTADITVVTITLMMLDSESARIMGSIVYFSIIISSSLRTSFVEGMYMGVLAALEGIVVSLLIKYGIYTPSPNFQFTATSFYYFIVGAPVLYILVAGFLGFYAERDREKSEKLEKYLKIIKVLQQKTQASSEIIIDNMTDGLLVLNENSRIIKANKSAMNILNNSELLGKNISEISEKFNTNFETILDVFSTKEAVSKEFMIREPIRKTLEVKASLMEIKGERNLIAIIRDITPSWGIVFDSTTKNPIRGAIIRVFNKIYNKLLQTLVTDDRGRFNFLVNPGQYFITVLKPGYQFPSKSNIGYKGEVIEVKETDKESSINVQIPIDPKKSQFSQNASPAIAKT